MNVYNSTIARLIIYIRSKLNQIKTKKKNTLGLQMGISEVTLSWAPTQLMIYHNYHPKVLQQISKSQKVFGYISYSAKHTIIPRPQSALAPKQFKFLKDVM